jgi:cytochrome b
VASIPSQSEDLHRRSYYEGRRVRVWDPIVRLFHWTVVTGVVANWFVFPDDRTIWHEVFGYTIAAALTIRILWGFAGTQHARFSSFVPGPRRLTRYLWDMLRGREERTLGHNPAGAVMMLALMFLLAVVSVSGYLIRVDLSEFGTLFGMPMLQVVFTTHEMASSAIFYLAIVHVVAALLVGWKHGESLVLSMITGRKREE